MLQRQTIRKTYDQPFGVLKFENYMLFLYNRFRGIDAFCTQIDNDFWKHDKNIEQILWYTLFF